MLVRMVLGVIGLIELLVPRRFGRFWVNLCCQNPEQVKLRPWVYTAIRVEGLALLTYAVWGSREHLEELPESARPAQWLSEDDRFPDVEVEPEDTPSLQPGTTRFDLAAALYQADDALAVSELVSRSEGTDWEVGRSSASATLYRMHRDGLVDRREREEGRGFEYWLSEEGERVLEGTDATLEPGATQMAD